MVIEVTFDFWVEAQFYWTARLPIALMEVIGRRKVEIYQALSPHPLEPGMLTTEGVFTVEDRRFRVLFAADQELIEVSSNKRQLRVLWIDELS